MSRWEFRLGNVSPPAPHRSRRLRVEHDQDRGNFPSTTNESLTQSLFKKIQGLGMMMVDAAP
jgi:hypothetical protein